MFRLPRKQNGLVILAVILFNGRQDATPAERESETVNEAAAGAGIFKLIGVCPGKDLGHTDTAAGIEVHMTGKGRQPARGYFHV